ncbi:MAG: hypothetical protein ACE5JH_06160 [Acidobacteriota bacterium]
MGKLRLTGTLLLAGIVFAPTGALPPCPAVGAMTMHCCDDNADCHQVRLSSDCSCVQTRAIANRPRTASGGSRDLNGPGPWPASAGAAAADAGITSHDPRPGSASAAALLAGRAPVPIYVLNSSFLR